MSRFSGPSAEDSLRSMGGAHKTVLESHERAHILRGFRHLPKVTYKGKSLPHRGYGLALTITSLAVVYVLLHCFHTLKLRFDGGSPARWLAEEGSDPYGSQCGAQEGGDAKQRGRRWPRRWIATLGHDGTATRHAPQQRVTGLGTSSTSARAEGLPSEGNQLAGRDLRQETEADGGEWSEQRLSQWLRLQLVNLFMSIETASRLCSSLLPALRDDQGLRLALKVSRILALELGALSLAPQSFEHLRLRAGRALIYLTTVSLNYGGQDSRHEAACQELRSLTGLITGICEPSVVHFQTSPRVLHAKLSALVGASIVVVGFSVNVLLGLSQHASGSSQGLPPILVEQQLGVLEALFETHGSIIVRDRLVRSHISSWQRNKSVWHLLSRGHFLLRRAPLPSSSIIIQSLIDAVKCAGGLLPPLSSVPAEAPAVLPASWQGGVSSPQEQPNYTFLHASDGLHWPALSALLGQQTQQLLQATQRRQVSLQDTTESRRSEGVQREAMDAEFWIAAGHGALAEAPLRQPAGCSVHYPEAGPSRHLNAPRQRGVFLQSPYAVGIPFVSPGVPQGHVIATVRSPALPHHSLLANLGNNSHWAASGQALPNTSPAGAFAARAPTQGTQDRLPVLAEQAHMHPRLSLSANSRMQGQGAQGAASPPPVGDEAGVTASEVDLSPTSFFPRR